MATASLFVRQTSPAARPSLARIHKKCLRPLFVHLFIHRSQKSVGRTSALEYFLWSKGPKENFKPWTTLSLLESMCGFHSRYCGWAQDGNWCSSICPFCPVVANPQRQRKKELFFKYSKQLVTKGCHRRYCLWVSKVLLEDRWPMITIPSISSNHPPLLRMN